ncbi:MAG: ATP-binding cassette domain-containing protein [Armatimonadetes bacterium]|nr:ATP-binding cassette domain-containing protein [Armatimonadota bacterium]
MLEARALTKYYDAQPAVENLDLRVEAGEIFCLLGANGAGKTTTVNMFLDFVRPTRGEACIDGQSVQSDPMRARARIAYVPEQVTMYPELSGLENLRYLLALSGRRGLSEAQFAGSLEAAGLAAEFHHRRMQGYSKGMRQKVAIALAMAREAKVLLLDEPTSGLDPVASNEFGQAIEALSERGAAVFMVTHDIFRAKETGHRVGIMKKGRLVETLATASVDHSKLERIYLEHMRD